MNQEVVVNASGKRGDTELTDANLQKIYADKLDFTSDLFPGRNTPEVVADRNRRAQLMLDTYVENFNKYKPSLELQKQFVAEIERSD